MRLCQICSHVEGTHAVFCPFHPSADPYKVRESEAEQVLAEIAKLLPLEGYEPGRETWLAAQNVVGELVRTVEQVDRRNAELERRLRNAISAARGSKEEGVSAQPAVEQGLPNVGPSMGFHDRLKVLLANHGAELRTASIGRSRGRLFWAISVLYKATLWSGRVWVPPDGDHCSDAVLDSIVADFIDSMRGPDE